MLSCAAPVAQDATHPPACGPMPALCARMQGLGCEEALIHLLNYVWPNIFETSPHVVQAVSGAIDGCRVALGPSAVLSYTLQVGTYGLLWCWKGIDLLHRGARPVANMVCVLRQVGRCHTKRPARPASATRRGAGGL